MSDPITVFIKTSDGRKLTVPDLTGSSTVLQLKEKLASLTKMSPDDLRLIYSGSLLQDDNTLSSYKISGDKCTLHMVRKTKVAPSQPAAVPAPEQQNHSRAHSFLAGDDDDDDDEGAGLNPQRAEEIIRAMASLRRGDMGPEALQIFERYISEIPELQGAPPEERANIFMGLMNRLMSQTIPDITPQQLSSAVSNAMNQLGLTGRSANLTSVTTQSIKNAFDQLFARLLQIAATTTRANNATATTTTTAGQPDQPVQGVQPAQPLQPHHQFITKEQLTTAVKNAMKAHNMS